MESTIIFLADGWSTSQLTRKDFKFLFSMQKQQFCKLIFKILSQNIMVVDNSELAENPFLVMKKLEPFLNISSFFVEGRVANKKDSVLLR